MKIYLDLCAIQRPLDTPNQVRIVLECDDKLLRSAKRVKDLTVKVINPVELVQEIEK